MKEGWVTWLLIAFGILVAIGGVIAYFRVVSSASSDHPPSTKDHRSEE
ncbi:hypothetical protein [Paenibacillus abyssi]|uniref:Uncharacterized protein n=1 Tax=Paenibacillus abyssi TaxID=1340531 RepID=A0A917G030_9BACL|nr:hypothetical protein [Paenibacillus abyssi]GGG16222.1 hypothetical protein GCM10010916_36410 [Paenibacillus abyssi]